MKSLNLIEFLLRFDSLQCRVVTGQVIKLLIKSDSIGECTLNPISTLKRKHLKSGEGQERSMLTNIPLVIVKFHATEENQFHMKKIKPGKTCMT